MNLVRTTARSGSVNGHSQSAFWAFCYISTGGRCEPPGGYCRSLTDRRLKHTHLQKAGHGLMSVTLEIASHDDAGWEHLARHAGSCWVLQRESCRKQR